MSDARVSALTAVILGTSDESKGPKFQGPQLFLVTAMLEHHSELSSAEVPI